MQQAKIYLNNNPSAADTNPHHIRPSQGKGFPRREGSFISSGQGAIQVIPKN
jgi:hypothetical protein